MQDAHDILKFLLHRCLGLLPLLCLQGMAVTRRGALDDDQWRALSAAQHMNPAVQLLPGNRAVKALQEGSKLNISKSCIGVQLFWALRGCRPGLQHYRFCTPHALSKPLSLDCFFCNCDEAACAAAKRQMPAESEQWLMQKLQAAGVCTEWCWQVQLSWWGAAFDFMHISQRAVMQSDGSSHFTDMYGVACRARLETDMRFCVAAVIALISVIRVHDLQHRMWICEEFLRTATSVATNCRCVVLSVGYRGVCLLEAGQLLTYAARLAQLLGGWVVTDYPWGTVLLPPM